MTVTTAVKTYPKLSFLLLLTLLFQSGVVFSRDSTTTAKLPDEGHDDNRNKIETNFEAEYDSLFSADNEDNLNNDFLLEANSSIFTYIAPNLSIESDVVVVFNGVEDGVR